MKKQLISLAASAALAGGLHGMEFHPVGFVSTSMGGAGVASAVGSMAGYYNPALLVKSGDAEFSLGVGVGVKERNLAENVDLLSDVEVESTFDQLENLGPDSLPSGTLQQDILTIQNTLEKMAREDSGISIMPTAELGVQIGNFGIGLFSYSDATVSAIIDENKLDVIVASEDFPTGYAKYNPLDNSFSEATDTEYYDSSIDYAIQGENATTYLHVSGIAVAEVPVSYARSYLTEYGEVAVGGSLKYMQGKTYQLKMAVETNSEDFEDKLDDAEHDASGFGLDLGFLYFPKEVDYLTVGLMAKNLNGPTFETAVGDDITVDPMIRAGVSYDAWDMLELALDLDITENETFIEGVNSRQIGGGLNFHPFSWLSLRGGLMKNLAESNEGAIMTAGFGLGTKWFQLDIAGQLSTKTGEYEGNEIPQYAKANVALVSKW